MRILVQLCMAPLNPAGRKVRSARLYMAIRFIHEVLTAIEQKIWAGPELAPRLTEDMLARAAAECSPSAMASALRLLKVSTGFPA